MGLLSDPHNRSKISGLIVKHGNLLSVLMYIGGIVWFLALAHPTYNGGVYFSENALLPGLVNTEFVGSGLQQYLDGYRAQAKVKSDSAVPLDWIYQELTALGLEVYTQQYQFTYPMRLLRNETATGENLYAILRAPRASSTENMVMSAPLRPAAAALSSTAGSVALMLAMAKHMKKQTYWSKDVIFLFTQHELIGMQAWLEGYNGASSSPTSHIKAGKISARAGVLQAAVNLEFDDIRFGGVDVLLTGINGNLPNLDLVNLVHRLAREENVASRSHNRSDLHTHDVAELVKHNILTMYSMMAQQATGMASGNHGLFLRYGVDALTIRGLPGTKHRLAIAGTLVESVFRSINNLLEKFHQSFFFYLLPCTYRYISIGLYIPPFALIAAAGLVQALALWNQFSRDVATRDVSLKTGQEAAFTADGNFTDEALSTVRLPDTVLQGVFQLIPILIGCHMSGLMILNAPGFFGSGEIKQLPAVDAVVLGALSGIVSSMMLAVTVIRKDEFDSLNWRLLKSLTLVYHGLVLFSLSLLNISLATIVGVITVPLYCLIRPLKSRILTAFNGLLVLLASPLTVAAVALFTYQHVMSGVTIDSTADVWTFLSSLHDAVVYGIIDHLVFDNYIMHIVCLLLYPIWLLMWSVIWMNI